MWDVSSRSGVATLRTAVHLLLSYLNAGSVMLRAEGRGSAETCLFVVCRREQMTAMFKECDVDRNGLVSLSEAKAVLLQPPLNFPEEKVTTVVFRPHCMHRVDAAYCNTVSK